MKEVFIRAPLYSPNNFIQNKNERSVHTCTFIPSKQLHSEQKSVIYIFTIFLQSILVCESEQDKLGFGHLFTILHVV